MKRKKRESLKTSYYRSFLIMIVVPILVITMCSIGIIRTMMKDAAIQNIRRAQDNIVSTLNTEVRDISLRLSHFLYVNDNEIMKLAAKTDTSNTEERYNYTGMLTESFNYAMVPVQDILATIFFMKSGRSTYMKDDTVLSRDDIEMTRWYQEAVNDKNTVKIGFYDTNVTTSRRSANTFTLVAALSPGIDMDRDNRIEMVSLFMSSQISEMIKNYDEETMLGETMILGKDGVVLYGSEKTERLLPKQYYRASEAEGQPGYWLLPEKTVFQQRVAGCNYVFVLSTEPETGCRVVSAVSALTLTRDFNSAAIVVVGVTLILFALFYYFTNYFLRNILDPVHRVVEGMEQVEGGHLSVYIEPSGQAEIRTMVNSFNHMAHQIGHLIEENEEQQQKKHQAELQALQSQINPHFLVNSLNSIRFMAQVAKFDGIRRMAEALINILATSFRSNAGFYSIKQELEVLDSYIYLMKIRYSDGFEVEYDVDESCTDYQVPRLILQPIVENSIVHGFREKVDDIGRIKLEIKRVGECIHISIEDNGAGMTREEIVQLMHGEGLEKDNHTGIGVNNVINRLKLNFGAGSRLIMESEPGIYTMTRIEIPVIQMDEEDTK